MAVYGSCLGDVHFVVSIARCLVVDSNVYANASVHLELHMNLHRSEQFHVLSVVARRLVLVFHGRIRRPGIRLVRVPQRGRSLSISGKRIENFIPIFVSFGYDLVTPCLESSSIRQRREQPLASAKLLPGTKRFRALCAEISSEHGETTKDTFPSTGSMLKRCLLRVLPRYSVSTFFRESCNLFSLLNLFFPIFLH